MTEQRHTRRTVIKTGAGAAALGALGFADSAEARKRHHHKKRTGHKPKPKRHHKAVKHHAHKAGKHGKHHHKHHQGA